MFDDFLRKRAESLGTKVINGLFMGMDLPTSSDKPYVISYNDYASGENVRACRAVRILLITSRMLRFAWSRQAAAPLSGCGKFAPAPTSWLHVRVPGCSDGLTPLCASAPAHPPGWRGQDPRG